MLKVYSYHFITSQYSALVSTSKPELKFKTLFVFLGYLQGELNRMVRNFDQTIEEKEVSVQKREEKETKESGYPVEPETGNDEPNPSLMAMKVRQMLK